jgi:hypothetical protein
MPSEHRLFWNIIQIILAKRGKNPYMWNIILKILIIGGNKYGSNR